MTPLLPATAGLRVTFANAPRRNVVHCCDALSMLRALPSGSVDAVITDPPYPEIDRDYGRLTELEWMTLMQAVVIETRRILKPSGSAVFILQANSEHLGSMRLWLWKFMVWCGETWNIVQDVYWWNYAKAPTAHVNRDYGLMRPSVKNCVWLGNVDCYRSQASILWRPSASMMAESVEDRALYYTSSGTSMRRGRVAATVLERGGTTPFNLIPLTNADSVTSGGAFGHGAATPFKLADWWVRYIVPPGGLVIDPFMGSGTLGLAAQANGCDYIGCDLSPEYCDVARRRLAQPYTLPLFAPPRAASE